MKTSLPKSVLIKKIIRENFKTKTFITNEKIKASPGQFIMVWLPGKAEKPFSITNNNPLTFTVMSVGSFTKILNKEVNPGDKIWYRGPFGKGTFKELKGKKVFVSGGCGCVPLYFLAKKLKEKRKTRVIVGAKTKKELLFVEKFKKLKLKVLVTTDDGSQGAKGQTTDSLEKILLREKIKVVYACGPEAMLKKVVDICKHYKVRYQVSLEEIIKCGFGVCGSCARSGKLICQDGPVFSKWPKND